MIDTSSNQHGKTVPIGFIGMNQGKDALDRCPLELLEQRNILVTPDQIRCDSCLLGENDESM